MIRDYTPDDIIFIEQIGRQLNSNYEFKINPYMRCLIYEENESINGFIVFSVIYEKAEIIDLAVKDENQRQSIGTKLMNAVIDECMKKECENITLEVRVSNQKAISFYRKNGFREISVRKSYYHDGEDALVMVKMVV